MKDHEHEWRLISEQKSHFLCGSLVGRSPAKFYCVHCLATRRKGTEQLLDGEAKEIDEITP